MFLVTDADAAAIRTIFEQEGELSAAIELRRRFPGIADNTRARVRPDHRRVAAVTASTGRGDPVASWRGTGVRQSGFRLF
jgi:hypothetical protein